MVSEWHYRKYLPKERDLYDDGFRNDKYEIEGKFRDAFSILKELGAEVPDEFYKTSYEVSDPD